MSIFLRGSVLFFKMSSLPEWAKDEEGNVLFNQALAKGANPGALLFKRSALAFIAAKEVATRGTMFCNYFVETHQIFNSLKILSICCSSSLFIVPVLYLLHSKLLFLFFSIFPLVVIPRLIYQICFHYFPLQLLSILASEPSLRFCSLF